MNPYRAPSPRDEYVFIPCWCGCGGDFYIELPRPKKLIDPKRTVSGGPG